MTNIEVDQQAFRDLVEREMRERGMNASQFAHFVGVSHTTIGRIIDPVNPSMPSPELLAKIALATKINLSTLIGILIPSVEHSYVDPRLLLLAERISKLPEDKRQLMDNIIAGMLLQND